MQITLTGNLRTSLVGIALMCIAYSDPSLAQADARGVSRVVVRGSDGTTRSEPAINLSWNAVITTCTGLKGAVRLELVAQGKSIPARLSRFGVLENICELTGAFGVEPAELASRTDVLVGTSIDLLHFVGSDGANRAPATIVRKLEGGHHRVFVVEPRDLASTARSPTSSSVATMSNGKIVGITWGAPGSTTLMGGVIVEFPNSIHFDEQLGTPTKASSNADRPENVLRPHEVRLGQVLNYATLAYHYGRTKEYEKSLVLAKQWTAEDKANPAPYVLAASTLTRLKFADQSVQEIDQALSIRPNYLPALAAKSGLRNMQGRKTEAEIIAAKALEVSASDGIDQSLRIGALTLLKRTEEAIAAADELFKSEPTADYAIAVRCRAYLAGRRGEAAVEACKTAANAMPESVDIWARLANSYSAVNRETDALEAAKRAISINPDTAEGWIVLGLSAERSGDTTRASEAEQRLQDIDKDAFTRFQSSRLGYACARESRAKSYAKAIEICREATRLNEGSATLLAALGVALIREKRIDEGIVAHEAALRIDEKLKTSWMDLTYAYAQKRDRNKTRAAYDRLRSLDYVAGDQIYPKIRALIE